MSRTHRLGLSAMVAMSVLGATRAHATTITRSQKGLLRPQEVEGRPVPNGSDAARSSAEAGCARDDGTAFEAWQRTRETMPDPSLSGLCEPQGPTGVQGPLGILGSQALEDHTVATGAAEGRNAPRTRA